MRESARDFIKRIDAQWSRERDRRQPRRFKDIGRQGFHLWDREAWTWQIQHNLPEKVHVVERFRYRESIGKRLRPGGAQPGAIEYRIGYWTVRGDGTWGWGQYSLLIPHADLKVLLNKARSEGTLLR